MDKDPDVTEVNNLLLQTEFKLECDNGDGDDQGMNRIIRYQIEKGPYTRDENSKQPMFTNTANRTSQSVDYNIPQSSIQASNGDNQVASVGEVVFNTTEKPYLCNICQKGFKHLNLLGVHMRTHTGEKPYVCNVCGKRFIRNHHLKEHSRVHTGEIRYKCDICGLGFKRSHQVTVHKQKHTGEMLYKCTDCKEGFSRRSSLLLHRRRMHGDSQVLLSNVNPCKQKKADDHFTTDIMSNLCLLGKFMRERRIDHDQPARIGMNEKSVEREFDDNVSSIQCNRNDVTHSQNVDQGHVIVNESETEVKVECIDDDAHYGRCSIRSDVIHNDNENSLQRLTNKLHVGTSNYDSYKRALCHGVGTCENKSNNADVTSKESCASGSENDLHGVVTKAISDCTERKAFKSAENPYRDPQSLPVIHAKDSIWYAICGNTSTGSDEATVHPQIHVGEKVYRCDGCKLKFDGKPAFMKHWKLMHASDSSSIRDLLGKVNEEATVGTFDRQKHASDVVNNVDKVEHKYSNGDGLETVNNTLSKSKQIKLELENSLPNGECSVTSKTNSCAFYFYGMPLDSQQKHTRADTSPEKGVIQKKPDLFSDVPQGTLTLNCEKVSLNECTALDFDAPQSPKGDKSQLMAKIGRDDDFHIELENVVIYGACSNSDAGHKHHIANYQSMSSEGKLAFKFKCGEIIDDKNSG